MELIGKIIAVFLYRLNVPRKEVEDFTDQIGRRDFQMLFDCFEAYDVQETRRISRAEGKSEGRIEGKAEAVLDLLEELGEVSEELRKVILTETDIPTLKSWLKLASKSDTIGDFINSSGISLNTAGMQETR